MVGAAACCCNALLFCSVYCCVAACLHCFDVVWRMGSLSHGLLSSCCAMPLFCWVFPSCSLFAALKSMYAVVDAFLWRLLRVACMLVRVGALLLLDAAV